MKSQEFRELFLAQMRKIGYSATWHDRGSLMSGYYYGESSGPTMTEFWSIEITVRNKSVLATVYKTYQGEFPQSTPEYQWQQNPGVLNGVFANRAFKLDDPVGVATEIIKWLSGVYPHMTERLSK